MAVPWAALARACAVGWLLLVAPLDLAITSGRLLPRLAATPDVWLVLVVGARALTVAIGMATGLTLVRQAPAARPLAGVWVVLEVATLAVVWGTAIVPTNRMPGLLAPTAAVYLGAAAVVWLAARGLPNTQPSR